MEHQSHEVSPQGHPTALFKRFFQGSFDCSTACRGEGKRVDLVINSGHDTLLDYEAWDKLGGRLHPEPGGDETLLDITGLNYYPDNQWYTNGDLLHEQHAEYRPLSSLLLEVWQRYQRPVLIAETGAEDVMRAPWLGSLCNRFIRHEFREQRLRVFRFFPSLMPLHGPTTGARPAACLGWLMPMATVPPTKLTRWRSAASKSG